MIVGRTGFVMCGFLNIDIAEKVNATAAMVSRAKTFDDVLAAAIKALASKAQTKGIKIEIKGKDAFKLPPWMLHAIVIPAKKRNFRSYWRAIREYSWEKLANGLKLSA